MDIFLDTSFIISLLLETEKTESARKFFNKTSEIAAIKKLATFDNDFKRVDYLEKVKI